MLPDLSFQWMENSGSSVRRYSVLNAPLLSNRPGRNIPRCDLEDEFVFLKVNLKSVYLAQ